VAWASGVSFLETEPAATARPGAPVSGGYRCAAALLPRPVARDHPRGVGPSPVCWRPVLTAAAAATLVLVAASPGYGYYRDELYFRLLADRPPAWGYVDQPPLTPLLARAAVRLLGDSLVALRLPAALCTAATIVVAALIAAELGGRRRAQALAAVLTATGLYPLLVGHTLLTSSVDMVAWALVWLLAARALLRRDGRWWLAAGAVFGLALYNKYLILMLGAGIALGVAVAGPRGAGVRRWLPAGAALAVAVGLPNLLYQFGHGWPQVRMAAALVSDSMRAGVPNRLLVLPGQLVLIGLPVAPVCAAGLVDLLRAPRWRAARALAVAHLVVLALVLATNGRLDYAAGTLVPLLAAGSVRAAGWLDGRWSRRLRVGIVGNAALSALVVLPVLPAGVLDRTPIPAVNPEVAGSVGWSRLADAVAAVQAGLPADEAARDVVLAQDYGQAGALDRYRAGRDLPDVYSGHNELARWVPPRSARTVIAVGIDPATLAGSFDRCAVAGRASVGGAGRGDILITVCDHRRVPWTLLWPRLAHLG
jgi:hypothetical protein